MIVPSFRGRPGMARLVSVCLLVLCLGGIHTGQAQNRVGRPGLADPVQANPILQLQQKVLEASLQGGLVALEGAVDPDAYIVGPGDQFSITAGGLAPQVQAIPVSAGGSLVLLEAGMIQAAGRTLAEVERDAVAALKQYYRNVPVQVALIQPRMFYVHVTGAVPEPGRYLMLPVARVDDAIQQSYASRAIERPDPQAENAPRIRTSATSERPLANPAYQPSLRNVRITHRDGSEALIDLMRYYAIGDTEHNPYLRDGDVITVPSYHEDQDVVRVSGDVVYPGKYAYRPGDTALDLLTLTAGPDVLDRIDEVRLSRRTGTATTETRLLDVAALRAGDAVPLEPGDHLNVLPREVTEAQINGMVQYPGTYSIEAGTTTLRQLVEMAGGLKNNADLQAAYLERRETFAFKESGSISDLDFFSRAFLQSSIHANRLVADVARALTGEGEDIVLYNQDRVVIPRDEGNVFITGNVPQPGYVRFVDGQPARYYVDQAGGPGPLTRGIYVFDGGTGEMRSGRNSVVRSGDTIFIDREAIAEATQPELAQLLISDQASRRQARILTTQNIISGVTAITSIITAYIAIRRTN